jgi:photosystem II stability/assembly factor-like uncharacterized protein
MNRIARISAVLLVVALVSCNVPVFTTPTDAPIGGMNTLIPSINPNPGQHDPSTATPTLIQPTIALPTVTPTLSPTPHLGIAHLAPGTALDIFSINMMDANIGWAVGREQGGTDWQHILRTSDGGATWSDVTPPEPAASAATLGSALGFFADGSSAWVTYHAGQPNAVPAAPIVWRTTDAGKTWTPSTPLDTNGLNEVYMPGSLQFTDGQHGWLLVHVGAGMMHDYVVLFTSTDGGAKWAKIVDPTNNDAGIQSCSKTGIVFRDANTGWLTGNCNGVEAGAMLFRTADSGHSWQAMALPAPVEKPDIFTSFDYNCSALDPSAIPGGKIFIGVKCNTASGILHYLFVSPDNGGSWGTYLYPGGALFFLDNVLGWALGADVQKTTDGGATWQKMSTVNWTGDFDFVAANLGWAVATDMNTNEIALVKTNDGGAHWTLIKPVMGN